MLENKCLVLDILSFCFLLYMLHILYLLTLIEIYKIFLLLLRLLIIYVGAIQTGKADYISRRYHIMVISMLKNLSQRYSSNYNIKFVGFISFYYAINLFFKGNLILLKGKIILLIQTCNRSIDPRYKLLKTINDETIFKLIA